MPASKVIAAVTSLANTKRLRPMAQEEFGLDGGLGIYRRGDRTAVVRFLNKALATEIVCALRCRRHHFMARSVGSNRIAEEFLLHADEEMAQADLIAERIVQLGGEPDFAPSTLNERSHLEYVTVTSVAEMVHENIAAKRVSISNYRDLIEFIGEDDPTTRRMLEGILAVEQSHADELLDLFQLKN